MSRAMGLKSRFVSLLGRAIGRHQGRRGAHFAAALLSLAPASALAQVTPLPGVELRQVRPFTPTPTKPTASLRAAVSPSGDYLPGKFVDPAGRTLGPAEDPRLTSGNRRMIYCHEAADLNSRPLFFEDVALERVGQKTLPCAQPVVSAAKFFFAFPLLVPRCAERESDRYLGTTEPRYYGPATAPSPFTVDVSEVDSKNVLIPLPKPTDLDKQTSVRSFDVVQVAFIESEADDREPRILTVAAQEPVDDLQQALPGFIHQTSDANSVQPQADVAPPAAKTPYPTTYVPFDASQRYLVQNASQSSAAAVTTTTSTVVPTSGTSTQSSPGYVLYPTADGGFIPVVKEAGPRPIAQPAVKQSPPRVGAEASADEQFPMMKHVLFGQVVGGEKIPSPAPANAPAPAQAPMPAEWGPNSPIHQENAYFDPEACDPGSCWGSCRPFVNVEATFLAPLNNSAPISAVAFDGLGNNYAFQTNSDNISYLGYAPRFTVGLGSCNGRGVRARYWALNNSGFDTNTLNLAVLNDFSGFTNFGQFKAYSIDLEATREFCWHRKTIIGFLGARYVGLSQAESLYAQVLAQPVTDLLTVQATSQAQFYGTGVTWGMQCIDPICNNCWGELDLFFGARGSAIFGQYRSDVASSAQVGGAGIFAVSNNEAHADRNDTMMIGELQLGLQWNKCCNPCLAISRVFARFGFEYQYWGLTNGLTTTANSFAGRVGVDQISIQTDQRNFSNINFVGLTLAAGCYW